VHIDRFELAGFAAPILMNSRRAIPDSLPPFLGFLMRTSAYVGTMRPLYHR
jgi:hypothetical protein